MGEKGGEETKVLQFFITIHVTTALFMGILLARRSIRLLAMSAMTMLHDVRCVLTWCTHESCAWHKPMHGFQFGDVKMANQAIFPPVSISHNNSILEIMEIIQSLMNGIKVFFK